MRWLKTPLAFALGAWLAMAPAPSVAQTALSPDAARDAAAGFLMTGRVDEAQDILDLLLARDPNDAKTLILSAHALRVTAQFQAAQQAAEQAWNAAETDQDRYDAAIAMAQALSSDNQKARAQIWLRRASHIAPSDMARDRAARDFQYVRSKTPFSANLSFGLSPSNNVNGAPRDNSFTVGDLVFVNTAAVPLSGVTINTGAHFRYNFAMDERRKDYVALGLAQSQVVFTEDTLPAGVDASDFKQQTLTATLGRDFSTETSRNSVALSTERLWYGGAHLYDELRLNYSQFRPLTDTTALQWSGRLAYTDRKDLARRSGVTGHAAATWINARQSGATLSFGGGLKRVLTDSASLTHTRANLGVGYTLARPVLGAQARVDFDAAFRWDDDLFYGAVARNDTSLTLSTSFLFKDFDIYGFAPKVSFNANRTHSNVTLFDAQTLGVSFGVQSLF